MTPNRTHSNQTSVAVVHPDLMMKGGSESVCMHILEALQDQYDVTLITISSPDFDDLNNFYGTNVQDVEIDLYDDLPLSIFRSISSVSSTIELSALRNTCFYRYVKDIQQSYDLMVSTSGEISLGSRAIQYIHFPRRGLIATDGRDAIPGYRGSDSSMYRPYDAVCRLLAGYSPQRISEDRLLVNSQWTADIVERIYDTSPDIVYPPINDQDFTDTEWEQREEGFVTIGRICPGKQVSRTIEIVDELHEWNDDVHLHLIGPVRNTSYADDIKRKVQSREYIYIEGECSREELVEAIQQHKYGIHGKEFEHFGMVVAEMVAGGVIPFVPNSGGQIDIVKNDERVLYREVSSAVEKIKTVMESPDEQDSIRQLLRESSTRYTRERFQQQIRSLVTEELAQTE